MNKIFGVLGVVAIAMAILVVTLTALSFAQAFVISTVWGWIVVPLFGLHPLAMGQAFALSVAIGALRGPGGWKPSPPKDKIKEALTSTLMWYPVIIGMAWVARHFI